jgi:aspartate aminotransferase
MSATPQPLPPHAAPLVSRRALDMPRSSIRRLFNAAQALAAQGVDVIRLDIGDPDFEMPQRMKDAISAALLRNQTHYSPMPGLPPLREAIARHASNRMERMLAEHGLTPATGGIALISAEQVVCSQGATQALNACLQLCCDRDSAALLPSIYFPNYMQQLELAGVEPRFYELDADFQPRLKTLPDAADGLRMLLINSPSNPTGALFPPRTVEALYAYAQRHNLWLVSDEAYADFVFAGSHLSPLALDLQRPPTERRVLGVYSFSKSYAATGLRMGYTIAPTAEAAQQLGLLNEPFTGSLTTPLQWGMLAALGTDDTAERRSLLLERRQLACDILRQHGFAVEPPAGGLFYFLDISATGLDADAFADALLAEEQVAVVPGSGFGLIPRRLPQGGLSFSPNELARRCVRLCFATPADRLREGVARLGRFIARQSG